METGKYLTTRASLELGPEGWFCVVLNDESGYVVWRSPEVVTRTLRWAEGTEPPRSSCYLPKTVEVLPAGEMGHSASGR